MMKYIIDFILIFTWDKSFRKNYFIGNYYLNKFGLHIFRIVVAHFLYRLRLLLLSFIVDKKTRINFLRDGFVVVDNIFPNDVFCKLKNDFVTHNDQINILNEGNTVTQRIFLPSRVRNNFNYLNEYILFSGIDKLMRWTGSKNRWPVFWLENLCNHSNLSAAPDPQRDPHTDSFHPCVKGWVYFDDANEYTGPFMYCPGSHKLSFKRLKWEYRQSILASKNRVLPDKNRYWDGSFRFSQEDLRELGYEFKNLSLPKNTLLIANVFGVHCRGYANIKSNRLTLWMQQRDNPFNPFFLPFPKFSGKLVENYYLKKIIQEKLTPSKDRAWSRGQFTRYEEKN